MQNKKKQFYTFLIFFYIMFVLVFGFIVINMITIAKKMEGPFIYFMFIPLLFIGVMAVLSVTRIIKNKQKYDKIFKVGQKAQEEYEKRISEVLESDTQEEKTYCKACGNEIKNDSEECSLCGTKR